MPDTPPLEWTTKPPTTPGWYWARNKGDLAGTFRAEQAVFVCHVFPACIVQANVPGLAASWMTYPGRADMLHQDQWDPACEWAGPLDPPA